jgi:hypothetical protein
MIPNSILLPPLSQKDRGEFESLCADYATAKANVSAYNNDSRVARKKELRDQLKTAPHDQLLTIGAELETLDASFAAAKRGAKQKVRALSPRYAAVMQRLLDRAQSHANELIAKAKTEWAKHFIAFGTEPVGDSPIVAHLVQWKKTLADQRSMLDLIASNSAPPPPPTAFLPYPTDNHEKK